MFVVMASDTHMIYTHIVDLVASLTGKKYKR